MNYIYLHGFNSAFDASSEKVMSLASLGSVTGITYNSFGTYQEIYSEICSKITNTNDVVFVGTSLGGFWAAEMGRKFGVPSVIINPCYDPYTMLRKYVGTPMVNYQTGLQNTLENDAVETYPSALSGEDTAFNFLPLVLLDMGDEVINSFETRETLSGFPMVHWDEGSHRFDHIEEALTHISQYINHCSYVDHID